MSEPPGSLADFVAAVSRQADPAAAAATGVARAVQMLDADLAAVVQGDVVVAQAGMGEADVTAGESALLGDGIDGVLLVIRPGRPLDANERELLAAMARTLGLARRLLRTIAAERAHQRLLSDLTRIQASISHRAPLPDVFDAIVTATCELFGDELPALYLVDPEDPGMLVLGAARNVDPDTLSEIQRRPIGEGAAGAAVSTEKLVVISDYEHAPNAMALFATRGLSTAMAAPIFEDGQVSGSLLIASYKPGRTYSEAEQDALTALARHASLALNDAKTVAAMSHQALHDQLTGLPNRELFRDRLDHALARARRTGSPVAVLFLDLDGFKAVNDTLGHEAGDELLIAVAERLSGSLRAEDTAARFGGDEFALLVEEVQDPRAATLVARRVLDGLAAPVRLRGRSFQIGASLGISVGSGSAAGLIREADVAMYRAKADGRGTFMVYVPSMQRENLDRLELQGDLACALADGEVTVHYQPIVDLSSGRIEGFEALARWEHPERGLVAPEVFIEAAEDSGLINALGLHVLSEACRQMAQWRAEEHGRKLSLLSVNLSGRQLLDDALVTSVADVLARTGLDPACLQLEVNESTLMRDGELTAGRLEALKRLGVRLAVDDFGTGLSALRNLRRFPVDSLKIAAPFIDALDQEGQDDALVRAIVDVARSFGLIAVAEGIERPAQAERVLALGSPYGQGFLFGGPRSAAETGALLAAAAAAEAGTRP